MNQILTSFSSGLQDRIPRSCGRRHMASGERLSRQRHHLHLLQPVKWTRVRVQNTRKERSWLQQTQPTIGTVQAKEQVQRALTARHSTSREGWQELRRSEMGSPDLRWRKPHHWLRDRETRSRKRTLGQVQRVQRHRYRVHCSESDGTRRLRVPNLRGERRRKIRAKLLHYSGEDLRGRGWRETRIR